MVQKHAARRLHYDFRLELGGVLKSWAIPKGPTLVPGESRLAVEVEDHPLDYGSFEGVIPPGEYGGGAVLLWDRGTWEPIGDPAAGLSKGKLDFVLHGEKLRGRWHLVRSAGRRGKPSWLLLKGRDAAARSAEDPTITEAAPASVVSGRSIVEVARSADRVWSGRSGARELAPSRRRRAKLPEWIEPQHATFVDRAPDGDDWVHELKLDGYRLLCHLDHGKVRLLTRSGNDWTASFPEIARGARELRATTALLDGEAVMFDAEGRTSFQALQRAVGRDGRARRSAGARPVFVAFDLLHLDGADLRESPLLERKQALERLLAGSALRYGAHFRGHGPAVFVAACRAGVEGVVSKRADAPYRSGRTRAWLKSKCSKNQELVIVGYSDPAGSRVAFGALLLGVHDESGKLRYAGKVGTGFDQKTLLELGRRLAPLARTEPSVIDPPPRPGVHWVEPKLLAQVSFSEWTRDGRVRHPVFLGLREDKPAREAVRERAQPLPSSGNVVAGVRLSTPERVYWPELGLTKRELAAYYETMAERVLPGLRQRPLTLVRCPQDRTSGCFHQKHVGASVPEAVARVLVHPDEEPYAMVSDLRSLVALVQIGALELHPWGARADRLDRPDQLVFDLDPDPAVRFGFVVETARALAALLEELGLRSFVRATGGKGLHLLVPLVRRASWEEAKSFSQRVARAMVREAPGELTAVMTLSRRQGKIFIDYLRNAAGATAIASYSPRAREGAPVALPLSWEELATLRAPLAISVREAPARLTEPDPWAELEASRRPLTGAARRLAELGL